MPKIKPTKEAKLLNTELQKAEIETKLEYWDGHKHVDIYVPKGKLYIEIDGAQHYTKVNQIISDFQRDHYSGVDGFRTLRIPSEAVKKNINKIIKAIEKIIIN